MAPLITCKHADTCKAPLCPLDTTKSDSRRVWYPDEPICIAREYQGVYWIQRQRQIAAVAGSKKGFFTLRMLKATKVVRDGILGMDPDSLPSERRRLQPQAAAASKERTTPPEDAPATPPAEPHPGHEQAPQDKRHVSKHSHRACRSKLPSRRLPRTATSHKSL